MAVISVEVPDTIAQKFEPFTIVQYDTFLSGAQEENIELTEAHWEVVRFVRAFYEEYETSPAIRALVKAMANKFGPEKGNSRYLQRLFKRGPAKQATKLAGLPKPAKCL